MSGGRNSSDGDCLSSPAVMGKRGTCHSTHLNGLRSMNLSTGLSEISDDLPKRMKQCADDVATSLDRIVVATGLKWPTVRESSAISQMQYLFPSPIMELTRRRHAAELVVFNRFSPAFEEGVRFGCHAWQAFYHVVLPRSHPG